MTQVGDILRVTKAVSGMGDSRNLLGRRIAWALCTEVSEGDTDVVWILPTAKELKDINECPYLAKIAGDQWTVVPTDKLPTKVLVALAKRALMGEAT